MGVPHREVGRAEVQASEIRVIVVDAARKMESSDDLRLALDWAAREQQLLVEAAYEHDVPELAYALESLIGDFGGRRIALERQYRR